MASTLVFPAGFRLLDTDGDPVSGAQIRFFEAGTSTPKEVFSDADLEQSLGTVVYTRSDGFPVASEGSSTVVLVYTGEGTYKMDILRSDDTTLYPVQDDIVGAPTLTPEAQEAPFMPVTTTGSNVTLDADDRGTLHNCQTNTVTFPAAATLGDGWWVIVRNGGSTTGRVILSAASGISYQGTSYTTLYLEPGQALMVVCDGTAYRAAGDAVLYTPAGFRPNTPGVIMIADRITAAPATSVGARYIVSSSYGSFSTHDVVEEVASGVFLGYTPTTDCGWLAYVQDEDAYYAFIGSAWLPVVINVNGLTADTNPDGTADSVPIWDASASSHKKSLLYYLPGAIIAIIEDQKTQNTAAQTLTADTDNVRELNTLVYNRATLVSLASNRFTLPAGTWEISWTSPIRNNVDNSSTHQSWLFNQSDSTVVQRGTSGSLNAENSDGVEMSVGSTVVTITDSKNFEVRHRPDENRAGGAPANLGTEVYTRVIVRRA